MGYWNAKFGLYGHKDVVQAQFDTVKKIVAQKAPKGRLNGVIFAAKDGEVLDAASIPDPHGGMAVGVPSLWSLPMVQFRLPLKGPGIGAHYDYSPIIPSRGSTILEWVTTAKKVCEKDGFDLFCDFFMHERHVIFVNMMSFDKSNAEQKGAVERIWGKLFEEGRKRGYSKYRGHVGVMGEWNHSSHLFIHLLKAASGAQYQNGLMLKKRRYGGRSLRLQQSCLSSLRRETQRRRGSQWYPLSRQAGYLA